MIEIQKQLKIAENAYARDLDDLIVKYAKALDLTLEQFAAQFTIEVHSPVFEYGEPLHDNTYPLKFMIEYRVRLKTEEEKDAERAFRAQKMASDAGLPSEEGFLR